MENHSKQMFVTLALVLFKLEVWWVLNILQCVLLGSLGFMCEIYVQCYSETLYGAISFDMTHRIPKLESV